MSGLGPNRDLIGLAGSRARLATPAMVLDLDVFERNIATFAGQCADAGLAFRPHAKTHKCADIAKAQIESGARGVCAASLHEAEALVAAGVAGVLITSPTIGAAPVRRLANLNAAADGLMATFDDAANGRDLAAAAGAAGKPLAVLIDIDIGMGRTGVASAEDAVALARLAEGEDFLNYAGVQGYSGRIQHINAYAERETQYAKQLESLVRTIAALTEAGLAPGIVSGGGTGSAAIDRGRAIFTEHQAGSYVFMDVQYNAVELIEGGGAPYRTALYIQNSVISNNADGFVTTNGGFKCFATDGPRPEIASGAPAGAAYEFFGDEHGRIVFAEPGQTLELGAVIELVTPHCDPTVNLHDYFHCVRGDTLCAIWPVHGRGTL